MTQIRFEDDKKELRIGNGVRLTAWANDMLYEEIFDPKYEEIVKFINDATVTLTEQSDEIRAKYVRNYDAILQVHIPTALQDQFKGRITVDDKKKEIRIPLRMHMIAMLYAFILVEVDTFKVTVNPYKMAGNQFYAQYDQEVRQLATFWTQIISKGSYQEIYSFKKPTDYYMMKSRFGHLATKSRQAVMAGKDEADLQEILESIKMNKTGFIPAHLKHNSRNFIRDISNNTSVTTLIHEEHNRMLEFLIFHWMFLKKQTTIFLSNDGKSVNVGMCNDIYVCTKEEFDASFISKGFSGIEITRLAQWEDFINEKTNPEFREFVQGMRAILGEEGKEGQTKTEQIKDKTTKVKEYMDKRLPLLPKVEFYIGTKNKEPDFVEMIVTEADSKKYYELQQKLWTETYKNEEWRRIFSKKTKIEDIEK